MLFSQLVCSKKTVPSVFENKFFFNAPSAMFGSLEYSSLVINLWCQVELNVPILRVVQVILCPWWKPGPGDALVHG